MADNAWRGDQPATKKSLVITIAGTPVATNTVKITVGSASVTYTVTGSVATSVVAAGLYALAVSAEAPPQFADVSFAYSAGDSTIGAANATPGYPVTISVAATGGGATISVGGGDLICTGPSDSANVLNWSAGHLPTTGERAVISGGADLLWNLGTGLIGCVLLDVYPEFDQGRIGLPDWTNSTGDSRYHEYRETHAKLATAAVVRIRGGVSRCRIKFNGDGGKVTVDATGSASDSGATAVEIQSPNVVADVFVNGGTLSINRTAAVAGSVSSVWVAGSGVVTVANGAVIGSFNVYDGAVTADAVVTNLYVYGGVYTQNGGSVGTVNGYGGLINLDHQQDVDSGFSAITINATAPLGPTNAPVVDCTRTANQKTCANSSYFKGGAALYNDYSNLQVESGGTLTMDRISVESSRLGRLVVMTSF